MPATGARHLRKRPQVGSARPIASAARSQSPRASRTRPSSRWAIDRRGRARARAAGSSRPPRAGRPGVERSRARRSSPARAGRARARAVLRDRPAPADRWRRGSAPGRRDPACRRGNGGERSRSPPPPQRVASARRGGSWRTRRGRRSGSGRARRRAAPPPPPRPATPFPELDPSSPACSKRGRGRRAPVRSRARVAWWPRAGGCPLRAVRSADLPAVGGREGGSPARRRLRPCDSTSASRWATASSSPEKT